ncbi:Piso0_004784 [Millerozyma farinosa CBS 7064]|uniref:Piso0_004784 protein n=1 Tax=Pichia sorbitophila (strain ATCC MYA-4447 / BCRC 22081 / CBS 7064 / NBRC 10061 / NRRL Y-12695) TaxID=559304 RepID=G8Y3D4_PICSO|nr:Piso0_004784 [Millerozyma farinosa CBS 7064]
MVSSIQFTKSQQDFESYLANNKYLVANFTAQWCGPCQQIKPVVDNFYQETEGEKFDIVRVDLDSQGELASRYSITAVPTFIFLEGKTEVNRIRGADTSALLTALNKFKEKASQDPSAGTRKGNGSSGNSTGTSLAKEVKNFIPKGFDILNDSIGFGEFEALNSLALFKNQEEGVRAVLKSGINERTAVVSDADSQILIYLPLMNLSKIYSILIKLRDVNETNEDSDLQLDDSEMKNETQGPSLIKVWPNLTSILSFDDTSSDTAAHAESISQDAKGWYECKLKYVRFQNVSSLNILIDGADEDFHTIVDKIVIVGVNGESKDQGTLKQLDDE